MTVYLLMQSTDLHAFSPLPTSTQHTTNDPRVIVLIGRSSTRGPTHDVRMKVVFGSQPKAGGAMTRQSIRDAVLDSVRARTTGTSGSGRLRGKVAVITGVGPDRAIGTAAARLFAREGVRHLYLLDFVEAPLIALAESLRKTYPATKVTSLRADAASPQAIAGLVDRVLEEEGHLDVFFANAGISQLRPIPRDESSGTEDDQVDPLVNELRLHARTMDAIGAEEFMEVMRINALSAFVAVKYASAAMGKTCADKGKEIPGGSIILTASVAGVKANAGPIPYSSSKAAVISIAQTASYELTGTNVRVNAICPGLIETDMTRAAFELAKMTGKEGKMGVLNPLLRQGIGAEVAQMALFLASDDSSYVNGQALPVDGGLTASMPYIRPKL